MILTWQAEELIQKLIRFDEGKTSTSIIGNLHKYRISNWNEKHMLVQDIDFDNFGVKKFNAIIYQ